ncbi:glycosyl hydrolase 53 family protein [Agromyces seonyuensis]|uniref:Arabinogalactan endo-beta-1,4-galactanase n=1 Tax=Agromyces seonyuensis TaxID=2662446 RepID=A0A6I4NZ23_9MICO|nr:glycosyl hydrolase 53 family protein [Agromyces seonyuensis]MWB99401.1 arabinogalactan endo-1,4-beta-galactosidase [Agromyces seonyuensis]
MQPTARRSRLIATAVLAAAVAATSFVATPAVAATNTFTNAGFESALAGWTRSGTTSASKVESGGYSGSSKLTHYLSSATSVTTSQAVTLSGTGWFTFDAVVKSGAGLGATKLVVSGCGSAQRTVPDTTAGDAWVHLSVPVNATSTSCTFAITTSGSAGAWANIDDLTVKSGKVSRAVRGADLSGVTKNEEQGAKYYTAAGAQIDPYTAFKNAGANLVRLKVWVNAADGSNSSAKVVTAAKRAEALGQQVMIDFHYSDTWADPGAQGVPAAWAGQSVSTMTTSLSNHTTSVLTALKNAGVTVDYVQIGNEINSGILWPYGQTWDVNTSDSYSTAQWDSLAGFLKAGIAASKAVFPSAKTIVHVTDVGSDVTWMLDPLVARGVVFDVLGLSYYGYWHGSLGNLQTQITNLGARYGKNVLVVETAYPWTLTDDTPTFTNVVSSSSSLVSGYPASTAGQAAWTRAVQDVVASAPGGRGIGVVYWEPAWTAQAGAGWDPANSSAGNAWENQAFFDYSSKQIAVSFATFGADASD